MCNPIPQVWIDADPEVEDLWEALEENISTVHIGSARSISNHHCHIEVDQAVKTAYKFFTGRDLPAV